MPHIIGYAYLAAIHCPACTAGMWQYGTDELHVDNNHPSAHPVTWQCDVNDIPHNLVDREGNLVSPVFSTDENAPDEYCDDCGEPLL